MWRKSRQFEVSKKSFLELKALCLDSEAAAASGKDNASGEGGRKDRFLQFRQNPNIQVRSDRDGSEWKKEIKSARNIANKLQEKSNRYSEYQSGDYMDPNTRDIHNRGAPLVDFERKRFDMGDQQRDMGNDDEYQRILFQEVEGEDSILSRDFDEGSDEAYLYSLLSSSSSYQIEKRQRNDAIRQSVARARRENG